MSATVRGALAKGEARPAVEVAQPSAVRSASTPGLSAVCDACGEQLDGADLNEAGREMWASHGAPSCFNGCGKMRTVITGAVQQVAL